ncbi:hypothetical protein LUZ60_007321 [Juncus effusus]|nr:hypothetical protein LUZ60_007321 [Juncus effusus]
MYQVLIKEKNYEKALDFAAKYGLDRDEVFQAQWSDSNKGNYEINSILSKINDKIFILSECVNCVGPTESALRALISFGFNITDKYKFNDESLLAWNMRIFRLKLLQCKDRLETFLGINMGRFSEEEYSKFVSFPLVKTAISLAENGKIGALNLLFKRHPYTISSNILNILSFVPETVPVHSYSQLLPSTNPPNSALLREPDWTECDKTVYYIQESINQSENTEKIKTEIIIKISDGFVWPSVDEITNWYINRSREMDSLSGQLENSISLMELASQKGVNGIIQFLDETKYLYHLIYFNETSDFTMDLATWESLGKYEKFKLLLKGAKEENIAQKLREKAVPYMLKYSEKDERETETETYLVKWVKEQARENNLSICLGVFANACGDRNAIEGLFRGVLEIVQTGIECVYLCSATDKWSIMGNILSNLLNLISRERVSGESSVSADLLDKLEKRVRVSQGHVEVGRLLAYYQVPKPMGFLTSTQSDQKTIQQLIRLILSKFSRRQPGRSDGDWAATWRDLLTLQEKAFPVLDSEYLLTEFIRGLLKAGKFSLARNYLRGTSNVNLPSEKAESLVVSAAKEYFFSASSLSSSEIWKAKECLSLLPNNLNVQAESDLIDALTIRLPNLGITLLPMQFKQIKDPIELIKTLISSQSGAYLNLEEILDISKLLGLKSEEEISSVEELIAREAASNGDLQLAADLCLGLVKKGHGPSWDLCVSIARGENENLDLESRKRFLGFGLCHCDEESVGELLSVWKDFEMQENIERVHNNIKRKGVFGKYPVEKLVEMVREVCDEVPKEEKERKKLLSFAEKELHWLIKLFNKEENNNNNTKIPSKKHYFPLKTRAINSVISWLATNGFSPKDELISSLAKSVLGPPISEEKDKLALLFLLNLANPLKGVSVIEEEIKGRNEYCEIHSMMSVGMAFSSLNNASKECDSPKERRELLLRGVFEKLSSLDSDEMDEMEEKQNTFWKEWKAKLEEEKRVTEQTRALQQIIPDIEASRFLSGDKNYIKNVIFSFVDSVKREKKQHVLKQAVKLADSYGLQRTEVLLHFFGCVLVSDCWENQDILSEIKEYRDEFAKSAMAVIQMISQSVYPQINGKNKQRLAYIFSILSACHARLKHSMDPVYIKCMDQETHSHLLEVYQYYKVLEKECLRVSFIKDLDFKNIAGLADLEFESFNQEVCRNVSEETVEVLAELAGSLIGIYDFALQKGLVLKEGVYKHYVLGLLASLEGRNEARPSNYIEALELQNLIREIEVNFDKCEKYVYFLSQNDVSFVIGKYFTLCLPVNFSRDPLDDPNWKETLFLLSNFWIKLLREIGEKISVLNCLKTFEGLISEGFISVNQGWETVSRFLKSGISKSGFLSSDVSFFCKSMILSGCEFESINDIYYSASENQSSNLVELYNDVASICLSGLVKESDYSTEDLYSLLSSLSKFTEKHSENLKIVRSEIWGQLCNFLERKELENHMRVFALQLMQAITGQNTKILPYEIISLVEKWESWDESYSLNNNNINNNNDNDDNNYSGNVQENAVLFSSSITSTLIALKSTQLISSIFPNVEITAEDLQTLDSAVSRFLQLSETISENISVEKINILEAVLEEWEPLFCSSQEKSNNDSLEDQIEWNNDNNDDDEWDNDGWETFPDEVVNENKSEIKSDLISVHPLHICWTDLIHKLITIGEINKTIYLFDRSIYKSKLILDEQESSDLIQTFGKKDLFLVLKLVSILPHERPREQCLQLIETKLQNSTVYDASHNNDYELLALVLYSGFLQTGPSTCPKLFSYLCYLIGHLARLCQDGIIKDFNEGQNRKERMLFIHMIFPYFISELVIKGELLLAGFMVSKWNHTRGSLGLIDVVYVSLKKYLENQILVQTENQETDLSGTIGFVVSVLKSRLSSLLKSAVLALGEESEN